MGAWVGVDAANSLTRVVGVLIIRCQVVNTACIGGCTIRLGAFVSLVIDIDGTASVTALALSADFGFLVLE